MNKQELYIDYYSDLALRAAQMSHCKRLQVGAVIIKDGQIIADGWNGMPSGMDNCCEEDGRTKDEVIHAEENAILKVASSHHSTIGATIFVTHAPCIRCARMIHRCGIQRVYFNKLYRDTDGIDFLKARGVGVYHWQKAL